MDRELIGVVQPGLSQAVRVGSIVTVSGQVAFLEDLTTVVGEGDSEAQARQCFANLERVLRDGGARLGDVVRLNGYLTSADHYRGYAAVKNRLFADISPASTVVIVSALLDPRLLMEIEAIAIIPGAELP